MSADDVQTPDELLELAVGYPRVVDRDAYDVAAFHRALAEYPPLCQTVSTGQRLFGGFSALALDVFSVLFKYNTTLLPRDDASAGRTAIAREMVGWLLSAPDLARLRGETVLDDDRAAFGTNLVAERALAVLTRHGSASKVSLMEEAEIAALEELLEDLRAQRDSADEVLANVDPDAADGVIAEIEDEIDETARELGSLLEGQKRRISNLPVDGQNRIRELVERLPERMEEAAAAANDIGRGLGGGGRTGEGASALHLGETLQKKPQLRRLAQMVGRFREFARGLRRRKFDDRPADVHEIQQGRDLARMLPYESAQLRHPALRALWRRRFVESQLLCYALRHDDRAARGPMVVCVDASGSMSGEKDLWAKAVALTLMDIARTQRRAFRGIVFSGDRHDLSVFDLLDSSRRGGGRSSADLSRLLSFAECFPGGGTDFVAPLSQSLELLEEKELAHGDIVLITDGQAFVPSNWLSEFLAAKERLDFSVFAVLVDVGGADVSRDTVARFADAVTTVSRLNAEAVKELFERL